MLHRRPRPRGSMENLEFLSRQSTPSLQLHFHLGTWLRPQVSIGTRPDRDSLTRDPCPQITRRVLATAHKATRPPSAHSNAPGSKISSAEEADRIGRGWMVARFPTTHYHGGAGVRPSPRRRFLTCHWSFGSTRSSRMASLKVSSCLLQSNTRLPCL